MKNAEGTMELTNQSKLLPVFYSSSVSLLCAFLSAMDLNMRTCLLPELVVLTNDTWRWRGLRPGEEF